MPPPKQTLRNRANDLSRLKALADWLPLLVQQREDSGFEVLTLRRERLAGGRYEVVDAFPNRVSARLG